MRYRSNGYTIMPRVFLISDGKSTKAGLVAGPDSDHLVSDMGVGGKTVKL